MATGKCDGGLGLMWYIGGSAVMVTRDYGLLEAASDFVAGTKTAVLASHLGE